jgi:GntR family transcriptional regulator
MTVSPAKWRDPISAGDDQAMPRGPQRPGETVAARLRQRIAAGEWAPGEALPTVAVLADQYDVARATVARALRVLETEGLVRVVPRWGTFRSGGDDPTSDLGLSPHVREAN